MGKMKPLPKFLLILLLVGGLVGGLYYFKDSDWLPKGKQAQGQKSVDKITSKDAKPVSVCVVTWGGYAGGQYFNNGFEASKDSRYYKDYGILVKFVLIDDYEKSRAAWKADQCNLLWTTADSFPIEAASMTEFEPKVEFQADWSRGGDVAVVSRGINSVSDLRGKKVALALDTPSHTFLLWLLEAGGLSYSDVDVKSAPSAPDAAAMFKAKAVDAAIVWSPDDEDLVRNVPGAHVLKSTKDAAYIIADVFYGKGPWVNSHKQELRALVEGWLRGAAEINTDPRAKAKAVDILTAGLQQPRDIMEKAIDNVRLTTFGDNVNFFNLEGSYQGVKGEDLYVKMSRDYKSIGRVSGNMPNWRSVVDLSVLKSLKLEGEMHAAEPAPTYTKATEAEANAPAYATKRVSVKFPTGSAVLDENAKALIDNAVAPIAKSFRSRIRVEGNTDITGSEEVNMMLSKKRAQAVSDYLVSQYRFDSNRFIVVGNGSAKPVADNATDTGRAKNRRTDFELLN